MKLTKEQQQAYDWAIKQSYPSVAATYAKILAGVITQLEAELAGMKLMEAEAESFAEGIVAENERLTTATERIKERAERVKEGEDWDLAGYCIEVINKALGGDNG